MCAFLDISQAFDRIWHDGLLFKLKKCLHPVYFLVIKSYLFERHFSTRVSDALSSISIMSTSVPQGGIFSPLLYNILKFTYTRILYFLLNNICIDNLFIYT